MKMNEDVVPVDIRLNNPRLFLEIAQLVDGDKFQKDIMRIRHQLKIVPSTLDLTKHHTNAPRHLFTSFKKLFKERQSFSEFESLASTLKLMLEREWLRRAGIKHENQPVDIASLNLLKKYKKSTYLLNAVTSVILHNEVNEKCFRVQGHPGSISLDYESVFTRLIFPGLDKQRRIKLTPHESAIIITPYSTLEEVTKTYKAFRKNIRKMSKIEPNKLNKILIQDRDHILAALSVWCTPDTIANIRRDRLWYWQKRKGMSYSKIHKTALTEGEYISRDGVIKAIGQYRLLLSTK